MSKVVFLIMSSDEKFDLALRMAYNSYKNKRFDDIKIIFFGPSQKKLIELTGDQKSMLEELIKEKIVDSACIGVAEAMKIKPNLERIGINLFPAGERVSLYIKQGYQILTF
ncbi:MAG: hypothetical protein QXV69_08385 [Sulfolobaceae archaeon]